MPGYYGGAGDFTLDAREIVKRVPGLQVWALDRRSQALEDTVALRRRARRAHHAQQAFDYYLGWLANPSIQPHFQPLDPAQLGFAKQWGLSIDAAGRAPRRAQRAAPGQARDPRRPLARRLDDRRLRELGLRRPPGYKDLDGLVLIDGGLLGSFSTPDLARDEEGAQGARRRTGPFVDLLGLGLPWAAGVVRRDRRASPR